jgi:hypothetical protein
LKVENEQPIGELVNETAIQPIKQPIEQPGRQQWLWSFEKSYICLLREQRKKQSREAHHLRTN